MSAYLVVDITVNDPETYQDYVAQVPKIVAKHGGSYLVRGGDPEALEGDWQPQRLVVLEFPSREAARAFVEDPEYAPVKAIRHAVADSRLVLASGA